MSTAIPEAIKAWIAAEASGSSFREAVGDRYYHVSAPDNSAFPLAVYAVSQAAEPQNFFQGGAYEIWRIAWTIWVDPNTGDDADALAIDAKLFARLNLKTLAPSGYDRAVVRCVRRGACSIDEDGYRVDSEYELRCARTS